MAAIEGRTSTVASGLGTHKEKKVCVDIHVQAAGSQICLQNICGQLFELPLHNNIWSRPETVETLDACNLVHKADVKLCKTGVSTGAVVPVGKTLRFVANSEVFADTLHRRFSECTCKSHANLSEISFSETAFYTRKLARGILDGVKAARKQCTET